MVKFEPKLLGFLCNWCAYAGADLAGVSRFQYPSNIRVIRVMCSGRVDPIHVIDALKTGIDGVAVLGCHHGDCHYQTGNYEAENKMKMTEKVLELVGINKKRLYLDWVSAAEGKRFSEVISEFTEDVRKIGPIKKDNNFQNKLILGQKIVESVRLRWLVGKQRELIEKGNVYNEKIPAEKIEDILIKNIYKEFDKQRILSKLNNKPSTVISLAKDLKISKKDIAKYVTSMENSGLVDILDFKNNSPVYTLTEKGGVE
jgi:F420-non-reducing hydrogenase iron-sulfur subunit